MSQLMTKPESSLETLHMSLMKDKKLSNSATSTDLDVINKNYNRLLNRLSQVKPEDLEKSEVRVELSSIWRNTENVDVFSDAGVESTSFQEDTVDEAVINRPETSVLSKLRLSENKVRDNTKKVRKISEKKIQKLKLLQKIEEERREKERKLKNKKLEERLISYTDVCVNSDQLNSAYNTISRYVRKHQYLKNVQLTRSDPFDKLIHGFANKLNMNKINELLDMMNNSKIRPSVQTFAGCFECLGRLSVDSVDNENLKTIYQQFKEHVSTTLEIFGAMIKLWCIFIFENFFIGLFVPRFNNQMHVYEESARECDENCATS